MLNHLNRSLLLDVGNSLAISENHLVDMAIAEYIERHKNELEK